jgi:Predicted aminoglycoside phosphotransferase
MTADVYKLGQDKVLKLYRGACSEEWVKLEAEIGRKLYEAGVFSPEVFDIVEIDGRRGIIFQRIFGKTITSIIEKEPWLFFYFVEKMAELQFKIHKNCIDGIPSQKEKFTFAIALSSEILGDRVNKILNYVDSLPVGDNVCHGDFYLSNIIISKGRPMVIDWTSAYRGDPSGDVARTYLIINSPAVLPGIPEIAAVMSKFPKWLTYKIYLNEYLRVAKAKIKDIDAWVLPVAAAKLKDRIPGEEKWLMKIIDKRLERLEE